MARFDRLTGLALLLVSLGICWESTRISLGTFHRPGPGFLSFLAGGAMAVFSLALVVKNYRGGEAITIWEPGANRKALGATIVFLIAYALLVDVLGFLIATVLFFVLISRVVARLEWKTTMILALSSSISAYLIFQVWLKAQLPPGVLV